MVAQPQLPWGATLAALGRVALGPELLYAPGGAPPPPRSQSAADRSCLPTALTVRASSPQASYTKAIKAEPENHVFFSNRSQAFLKLSKVTKALEDADKCIALAPTFVKGYHRKARLGVGLTYP